MRVAFFGGTFDPIHRGHLKIASAAAFAFGLDRVLFAPAGEQPLKPGAVSASFADRLEMVRLALANDQPRFAASTVDTPRADGRPNYTVDALTALAAEYPGAELFVLAGADSFLDLRRWRSPERLLTLAEWIVVGRPDVALTADAIAAAVPIEAQRARVHVLTNLHEEISATALRRRLRAGLPCAGMLPPGVEDYIAAHRLYRGDRGVQ